MNFIKAYRIISLKRLPRQLIKRLLRRIYTMAYVINDDCISCGACAAGCPVEAISEGASHYEINADVCVDCGACASVCHQMVFNVPEWYLHKTPDQFNTDSGFSFFSLFNYCLKSLERSANLVCSGSHAILTVPIGPLRCLAIIISAIPFCSVSLL